MDETTSSRLGPRWGACGSLWAVNTGQPAESAIRSGAGYLSERHFDAALAHLRSAVAWQQRALKSNPNQPAYRRRLADHFRNLIQAAQGAGRTTEAEEARRKLADLLGS
jgi:hypothetical protein